MRTRTRYLVMPLVGTLLAGCAADVPRDEAVSADDTLIANALSAAPEFIAQGATVVGREKNGQMRTVREGSNGWTCFPDNPDTPGNMPMCVDRPGLAWVQAWMMGQVPGEGPVSTAYLLQGSSFPSFQDPEAKSPPAGGAWVTTGPILMIMNVAGRLNGIPAGENPNVNEPFVMMQNTPYEHLMIPVGSPPASLAR